MTIIYIKIILFRALHAADTSRSCDRLRFSVAFWHTLRGDGSDPFGSGTKASLSWQIRHVSLLHWQQIRM